MLSPDDLELVRRDPLLPGLPVLLDTEAFVDLLRRFLPGLNGPAEHQYLRYKPGTSCLVGYRLKLEDEETEVTARAYRLDAEDKLAKARERQRDTSHRSPIVVQDLAVVISVFPEDRNLRILGRLGDRDACRELLTRLFPEHPDWREGALRILRYKAERRCVTQLVVGGIPRAVVKFYTEDAYHTASLASKRLNSRGTLRLPRRLGRLLRHHVVAYEWLTGMLLDEALSSNDVSSGDARRVGIALAELHTLNHRGMNEITRERETASLLEAAEAVGYLHPPLTGRVRRAVGEITQQIRNLPPAHHAVHGDFYAKQVLLQQETVGVLDLDEAGCGDPAGDVGNFCAHLYRNVLSGRSAWDRAESLAAAFCEAYGDWGRRDVLDRCNLYTAAALLRLALDPFRSREPEWKARMAGILDRIDIHLYGQSTADLRPHRSADKPPGAHEAVAVEDRFHLSGDLQMPFVRGALDPVEARNRLASLADRLPGLERPIRLRAIRVMRYKPQRRCLVEYELTADDGAVVILGKARAKGTDKTTYRLMESLRETGFDESAADGVCVPRPLALVPAWQMWLQEKVAGVPATHLLSGPDGPQLARRIAEAIHKLHQTEVPTHRRHTRADEMRILADRLGDVAQSRPEWAERLERVVDACGRLADGLPVTGRCKIHRDFYPDQVLVAGDRLYLLDLDLYCHGEPALDIGNFRAHLIEQALRSSHDPYALSAVETALTDRYAELAGESILETVDAWTTISLARHIAISTRFSDRRPFTEPLLKLCEERLGI